MNFAEQLTASCDAELATRIFLQIGSGIAYLNSLGISHGDAHVGNYGICGIPDGPPICFKIFDLGTAQKVENCDFLEDSKDLAASILELMSDYLKDTQVKLEFLPTTLPKSNSYRFMAIYLELCSIWWQRG